jgi:hypothetical protein
MPSLIVVGKTRTDRFALDQAVTVIGRDKGVSLELSDFKVSRRHALLVRTSEGFFVKDLGSRNGLTVNQVQLPSRQQTRLKNGDVLAIGQTTLIFKDLQADGDEDEAAQEPTRTIDIPVEPDQVPRVDELQPEPPEEDLTKTPTPPEPPQTPAPPRRAATPPQPTPRRRAPTGRGDAIPRALAPGDPSSGRIAKALGAPPAEVLLVQALERSERERAFYRNIALLMVCLLVGLLAWLLVTALRGEQAPQTAAVQTTVQGAPPSPAASAEVPAPVERAQLDAEQFAVSVQPVLAQHCSGCHSYVGRGGDLILANSSDPLTVEANFHAALAFVKASDPERSPLLLAPLPKSEGGLAHGGGDVLTLADEAWKTIHRWVTTPAGQETPQPVASAPRADAPPQARIAPAADSVAVGQPLGLDGTQSADPEGAELFFRWSLESRPQGSQATLTGANLPQATLTPDVSGRYEVMLLVHDGTESASARVSVRAVLPPSDPGRRQAVLGAAQRLLGQTLSDDQAEQLANQGRAEVAALFLADERLFSHWWAEELAYLGLSGDFAPQGEPWVSMPRRLQSKRFSVQDVLYALAVGSAWSSKYAGKDAYADAILSRFLGLDPAQAQAERAAARRLYDGYPAELLGQKGEVQADLVRIALDDPTARGHLLRRSYRAVTGQPIDAASLQVGLERLRADPHAFFELRVEWALQDL